MAGSTTTTSSAWQQFQDLAVEAARTQIRLARQYVDVTMRLGRDGWSDPDYLRRLGHEGDRYLRELTDLNLRHARALQELARDSGERILDLSTGGRHTTHGRHDVRLALDVSGPVGGHATGTFTVANTRDETAHVSFETGSLRATQHDGKAFRPKVAFDPAGLDLAPGAEARVELAVHLDKGQFEAGRTYRGEVRVLGGTDIVLELTVRVRDAATSSPPHAAVRPADPAVSTAPARSTTKAATKSPAKKTAKKVAKKSPTSRTTAKRSAAARRTPPQQG